MVERISGKNRIETAIEASKLAYDRANTVILAGSKGEVDALTGTLLASHEDGPLLLTNRDLLAKDVKDELKRLKAKKIIILGGYSVVSEKVQEELEKDYKIERIAGSNREKTANKVAKRVKGEAANHVFLALGYGELADALAIGPVSAIKNIPVLLTKTKTIPKDTESILSDLNVKDITIVGGNSAVNNSIEKELKNMGYEVDRIAGDRRTETAIKIADKYFPNSKDFYQKTLVAYGWSYADALVGGYLGAKLEAPILLTKDKELSPDTQEYISNNTKKTYVLGGEAVVSKSVAREIEDSIRVFKNIPGGGYIITYFGDYYNSSGEASPAVTISGMDNSGNSFSASVSTIDWADPAKRKIVLSFFEESPNPDFQAEDHEAIKAIMKSEFEE